MSTTLKEILDIILLEEDEDVIEPENNDKTNNTNTNPALGKTQQVNKIDIKANKKGLWIYDHLANKKKMYVVINGKYSLTREKLNKDFGFNLDEKEYNKIVREMKNIIKNYPDKAIGIDYPPYDIHITLNQNNGKHYIQEIGVEAPNEKETSNNS